QKPEGVTVVRRLWCDPFPGPYPAFTTYSSYWRPGGYSGPLSLPANNWSCAAVIFWPQVAFRQVQPARHSICVNGHLYCCNSYQPPSKDTRLERLADDIQRPSR